MKRMILTSGMGLIIVVSTMLLKIFIGIPDYYYGLGVGFGGALGLVGIVVSYKVMNKKKYDKTNK